MPVSRGWPAQVFTGQALSIFVSALATASEAAVFDDFKVRQSVEAETRYYWQDALYGQNSPLRPSLAWEPELAWEPDSEVALYAKGFIRENFIDSNRSHADIRELYLVFQQDSWDLVVGANRVFWGVTESRHLVDLINQVDLIEDIDEEDRLGQPMINLNLQQDWGRIALFYLPFFRERTLPNDNDRFRLPLTIRESPTYESGAKRWHGDFAVRYSHYIDSLDFGLSYFKGTNREPLLVPEQTDIVDGRLVLELRPEYLQIQQTGIDLQYTFEAWLFKFEAVWRQSKVDSFIAGVGGFEYTLYQLFDSPLDLGILFEYLGDDRDDRIDPVQGDHDIFAGLRLAFNDAEGSSLLFGTINDIEYGSRMLSIEAETRLRDDIRLELTARTLAARDKSDPAYLFRQDDYIQMTIRYFF